jgi:serine/threonine protein kinase
MPESNTFASAQRALQAMDNAPVSVNAISKYGYNLLARLGEGAQGVVYKAEYNGSGRRGDLKPNTPVAIKFIPSSGLNPQEVLLHARLRHMNIVRIYDVFACAPPSPRFGASSML